MTTSTHGTKQTFERARFTSAIGGGKRTSLIHALVSANDPFRTFALCRTRCVTAHRTREVGLHQATHKVEQTGHKSALDFAVIFSENRARCRWDRV